MNEKEVKEILEIILRKLQNKRFTWKLEGSANLKIQGINTNIKDLDITTNNEGIKIFRETLKEFIKKDSFSKKINGHSILCEIKKQEVEINSYGDRKLNMFNKTKTINWRNLSIPILPLEYALIFYKTINRKEKVDLISRYLNNHSS